MVGLFLQLKGPIHTALRGISGSVGLIGYLILFLSIFYFNFNWRFKYFLMKANIRINSS